jgi:hypothetical protein
MLPLGTYVTVHGYFSAADTQQDCTVDILYLNNWCMCSVRDSPVLAHWDGDCNEVSAFGSAVLARSVFLTLHVVANMLGIFVAQFNNKVWSCQK